MPQPRILIGALSGAKYQDRRDACLATWMAHLPRHENIADAVFLMADPNTDAPQTHRIGSTLYLPVPDNYKSLPQRTRHFCIWALQQGGWDWLFKCDDDTYIALDRLAAYELPPGVDYIGAEWKPKVAYGSGGAGYLISRRAAEIVAEGLQELTGAEDLLVGKLLAKYGIGLHIEPRFIPFGHVARPNRRPMPNNSLITTHAVFPPEFATIHQELYPPGEESAAVPARSLEVVPDAEHGTG